MRSKSEQSQNMYGISRMDDSTHRTHAWRVSLRRHGRSLVKNFPDKKYGGSRLALMAAMQHRDELLVLHPPISRKEFSSAPRRNNRTGITGVYKYVKTYPLRNGGFGESWYWEANWPTQQGQSRRASFGVKRYGEDMAKQLAIRARERGMREVQGVFWASERGDQDLTMLPALYERKSSSQHHA